LILKIEKSARPLKFEEASLIADVLGIDLASLSQYIDDEAMAEAVAEIQRINLTIGRWRRYIEEELPERTRKSEQEARQFIERSTAAKREAEQRLREAGGVQDGDGHWRTKDGQVLLVDDVAEADHA
jgi:predicted transcriptional regulator